MEIVRASWPPPPALPRFPRTFMNLRQLTMNIPAMLLKIGYLTTPPSASGVSLSEFWAYVRYLAAVTGDTDLRLTRAFIDLDAHQKTILSDDFGMGVPMTWLTQALDLQEICDGRYFLDRFAARAGAVARRAAKRGPSKTPDFIARDARDVWHVVECKGTQSGKAYQDRQITSGIVQKQSVVFPRGHTGQRLVCALSIGLTGGPESSMLRVVDPEPEKPVMIGTDEMEFAHDAAQRGTVAKALRLAGFEATADVTAAPMGRFAYSAREPRRRVEEERRRVVEARDAKAREELADVDAGTRWTARGARYRGREAVIEMPRTLEIDGRTVKRVTLRQGVNEDVLAELRERPTVEEILSEASIDWDDAGGSTVIESDEQFAALQIGDLYRSEMSLQS